MDLNLNTKLKYLIVDDNEAMRKMIRQSICNDEDIIIECPDGTDAVDAYARLRPEFVLMDIRMKTMGGIQATKTIYEQFPDAKILIVTDYNTAAFRQAAFNAGALAFFSKENLVEIKEFINNAVFK